jgi:hypothetical protein
MMMTEMDIETSVYNVHLTRLIAREDFIKLYDVFLLKLGSGTFSAQAVMITLYNLFLLKLGSRITTDVVL